VLIIYKSPFVLQKHKEDTYESDTELMGEVKPRLPISLSGKEFGGGRDDDPEDAAIMDEEDTPEDMDEEESAWRCRDERCGDNGHT